ncbi:hypothetical protein ACIG3E_23490 [Streptomyces sp. NPDC053474]
MDGYHEARWTLLFYDAADEEKHAAYQRKRDEEEAAYQRARLLQSR